MWQDLYRATYQYLASLGLGREDAEDIAQETLIAAYVHMDAVRPGRLRAWIRAVARRKYIDWLRRSKKGVILVSLPEDVSQDDLANPEASILKGEACEVVRRIMSDLGRTDRILLAMRYNLGLTMQEMAMALRMKPNTVKVALYRARQRFKAEYSRLLGGRE